MTPCLRVVSHHVKSKGKIQYGTDYEGSEWEWKYSSGFSLTSALIGEGGQRHALAALTPGKTRYPLYRRLGEPQSPSGRVRKISPLQRFKPRTFQPVAGSYTD